MWRFTATTTCAIGLTRRISRPGIPRLGNLHWPRADAPFNRIVHPRGWRAFMEYSNGIVGDMCIHMLDAVRWMLDLGWPTSVSSAGGILVDKAAKANISDTQTAVFKFPEFPVVWTHRTWGTAPDPDYPWGGTIYGEKGTLKFSVMSYDFIPVAKEGKRIHKDVTYELEQYPEDKTEKDLERHVAPAIRYHMKDMLKAIAERSKPVADIEQGHISTASCILANLAMKTGRTLRWDPAKHEVIGDPEATRLLAPPYRKGYTRPTRRKSKCGDRELRSGNVNPAAACGQGGAGLRHTQPDQDRDDSPGAHGLDQVANLEICVAVMCVPCGRNLPEERVGLVEEQHASGAFSAREQRSQLLFCLADVFPRPQYRFPQGGNHLGCKGLPGTGGACERTVANRDDGGTRRPALPCQWIQLLPS